MLDLLDIQGNILRGYRSFDFARFLSLRIESEAAGRKFIGDLLDADLITPGQWATRPVATTNIAFSFGGLQAMCLQAECLGSFPPEFQQGMRGRAALLGDVGAADPANWDNPWKDNSVHLFVSCYGATLADLNARSTRVVGVARAAGNNRITQLKPDQDAALLVVEGERRRTEHFGFDDGFSNPDVEWVPDDGGPGDTGNPGADGKMHKVRLGEFILGHRAEGGEVGPMPAPTMLAFNGSFLVVRKLEEHVVAFRQFLKGHAPLIARALGSAIPPGINPEEYLASKMLGRWKDGSSLQLYPGGPGSDPRNDFGYADDPEGTRVPLGAHVRRAYPRDSLGFDGDLVRRRRLIRRGIAYGTYLDSGAEEAGNDGEPIDDTGRGLMFLCFNASIDHQFEFVQRQWLNYGDEFDQGDDPDPIVGIDRADGSAVSVAGPALGRDRRNERQMVIPGDVRTGRPPYLCIGIPQFVTAKGGEYFFAPSLTALRLLATGRIVVS